MQRFFSLCNSYVFGSRLKRCNDKFQFHRLICMDSVLLMHRCTPGIIAADTHLLCSDSDPCVANTWKFIQMHCVFEFIGTVWQYTHFKRSRCLLERQTMLHIIMDRERSYTGTVAAFLRIEITGKIFFCCRLPQSQSCPCASVALIFIRTESVIL